MHNHTCRVHACGRKPVGYSPLCRSHLRLKARHGSEFQSPVTKGELSKIKKKVENLINGRANAEAVWSRLEESAEALKADAFAKARATGKGIRWERAAESDIFAACEAGTRDVILTGSAVAYMTAADRKRFVSDDAMFMTAGRRLRLIAPGNYSITLGPSTGKIHRTPRDCSPRRLLHIGKRLLLTFGGAGLALHSAEVELAKRVEEARTATTRAILGETFAEPQV